MCVSTGLQVELPFGYYGRVAPRSGLAAKNFVDVGAGVVDSDYRGELKVLLFNFGSTDFERLTVRFVKLNADAQEPVYGSAAAAGADLFSAEDCVVPAHGKMCVSTGLQVELPFGYYGRVAPRSGLAAKNFVDVGAGVVDSDYRGELKVKKGDRIAQLICERIAHCTFMQCESLTDTTRGAGGFGSTGK
ncbi:putative dUTP diphosphatase [Ancylostoma caninum]|uniref:Deoxyuridine 5'-triphosphate nucleotidohydrolase n=1 Tax=Ancylostoma caninum TaxID=29170 RepID=A0A368FT83_ANCCA|nr:putative dUTP diphosphatase [Ancylostoma caninum]